MTRIRTTVANQIHSYNFRQELLINGLQIRTGPENRIYYPLLNKIHNSVRCEIEDQLMEEFK
jgi:hypothetical protein